MSTTPITEQPKHQAIPAAAPVARREWCCGTPIDAPHADSCAYAPTPESGYDGHDDHVHVLISESASEPPPAPSEVSAAAPRSYGIRKAEEFDLDLPSGGLVRYRKLLPGQLLKLRLVEVMDGFTPELLSAVRSGDADSAQDATMKALADPDTNGKIFGPVDRVVAAAVVIPKVVLDGPTTDTQVNVDDVELEDKLAIFSAAVGEQLAGLKSVRDQPAAGV